MDIKKILKQKNPCSYLSCGNCRKFFNHTYESEKECPYLNLYCKLNLQQLLCIENWNKIFKKIIVNTDYNKKNQLEKFLQENNMSWRSKYNYVFNFENGLARVLKIIDGEDKWGCINTKGEEIVPCVYDYVYDFENGFAIVSKKINMELKWGVVNTEGKEVVPCVYYYVCSFNNGLAVVCKKINMELKWGVVNTEGKEVIPCVYDSDSVYSALKDYKKKNSIENFLEV